MERISDKPLDLDTLLEETANPESGALVVFSGTVRNHHEGRSVKAISYTVYKPLAERVLAEIEQEAVSRFPIQSCRIVHRIGELAVGEDSVLVVVRSAHRGDAFDAARFAIDTLKQRAPVWKNEVYADGSSRYQDGVPLEGQ
ncbi:molybdenum cofactor biosynthesis protein MoaE [Alkalilimnicola ehrlichii MLHE-1]|uniref:Molybdopterin synthase catalytic subunit n=1 Tax=Alkalilimnicola ehrlichii (strain ATCC BAA-1101 / DSM 17681 / MLHE-1) TaxID=187272 RepID=Q0A8D1_ALKEH|nr:molybdenum cofactor biosynthesis protein MoaE [Alkalilimnicola ehrlichii]ABI56906.1 molybdopterin synthase subunit MoaE [Alkalilimnicola ehrlichii MLHE-1]